MADFDVFVEWLVARYRKVLVFEPVGDDFRVRRWGPGREGARVGDYMPGVIGEDAFRDGKLTEKEIVARCERFLATL